MAGQRKRYSTELKTKVALAAIKGHKTANEIAAEYEVPEYRIFYPRSNDACSMSDKIYMGGCNLLIQVRHV